MTYGSGPNDPFGNAPFGQSPVPPPYGGPPVFTAPPTPGGGKTNTFATLSLVFAFLFAPAGVVLGHMGLAQIKRTGERGRDRALIGTILSYVFTVVAVAGLVLWAVVPAEPKAPPAQSASGTPATTTATTAPGLAGPGPVLANQLPGYLLTLDEIKQIANAPNDYKVSDTTTISGDDGLTVTPPGCLTALFGGGAGIYLRSGMFGTSARTLALVPPMKQLGIAGMEQRVTQFRNASEASRQADAIVAEWRRCAGPVTLVFADGTPTSRYQVGQVTSAASNPTIMLLTSAMSNEPSLPNLRAVAAKANVVVDIHMFGGSLGTGAEAVAAAILARIPG